MESVYFFVNDATVTHKWCYYKVITELRVEKGIR